VNAHFDKLETVRFNIMRQSSSLSATKEISSDLCKIFCLHFRVLLEYLSVRVVGSVLLPVLPSEWNNCVSTDCTSRNLSTELQSGVQDNTN
jgi:hypothetical protein